MDSSDVLSDERKIKAIADYFWSIANADDAEQRTWNSADRAVGPREGFIRDGDVRDLQWLSQFLRAWLLKSHGVVACQSSYEVCVAVFNYTRDNYNHGSDRFQRIVLWHLHSEMDQPSVVPILTREEFEQIAQFTASDRNRLYERFIADIRAQQHPPA